MSEHEGQTDGLGRRQLLKRGALMGGALVWATPVVQTLSGPALAATGSPGDVGGNGAPSWVMVWFLCDTGYYVVEYDQHGNAKVCNASPSDASKDIKDAPLAKAKLQQIYGTYGPYQPSCPPHVTSGLSPDGDLLITLTDSHCRIVNWFLHDGSCQQTGDDKFRWQNDGELEQVAIIYDRGARWEFQKCLATQP